MGSAAFDATCVVLEADGRVPPEAVAAARGPVAVIVRCPGVVSGRGDSFELLPRTLDAVALAEVCLPAAGCRGTEVGVFGYVLLMSG